MASAFCRRGLPAQFWCAARAIAPDADVIGVAFASPFRSLLGHRGLSHSLLFAVAVAAVLVTLGFRRTPDGVSRVRLGLYFFLATASHGVLDALTDGGPGVAFFAPFHDTRYFFPFRPIVVSPLGIRPFFSEWGVRAIESELVWIWLPSLALTGLVQLVRRGSAGVRPDPRR